MEKLDRLLSAVAEFKSVAISHGRYGAASATCAAVAMFLSHRTGLEAGYSLIAGSLLPLWPLTWYFNRSAAAESELRRWQAWKADSLITEADADRLKGETIRAHSRHLYGGLGIPIETPKKKSPPKKP